MANSDTLPDVCEGSHWDPLKEALRGYREKVGSPSYQEMADRVAARREAQGANAYEARVGKTTIYDAFKNGQRRVNLDLIKEIGAVLGACDDEVEGWIASCHQLDAAEGAGKQIPQRALGVTVAILAGAFLLDLFGVWLTGVLPIELYLDMIGTAVAAMAVGPWRGAMVGYLASVASYLLGHGSASLEFGVIQVVGALIWGYGIRSLCGRTASRYLLLNVMVACVSTVIAVPIIVSLGGRTGHGTDTFFTSLEASGHTLWASVVSGNVVTSLADKLISGFLALLVVATLPGAYRARFPLAQVLGRRQTAYGSSRRAWRVDGFEGARSRRREQGASLSTCPVKDP